MSKTIEIQVEKVKTLVDGLRKNINEVSGKGISPQSLDEMEGEARLLGEASSEIDAMREELSAKVKRMNGILSSMKEKYIASKAVIKHNYEQEQWARFGVQDKR